MGLGKFQVLVKNPSCIHDYIQRLNTFIINSSDKKLQALRIN